MHPPTQAQKAYEKEQLQINAEVDFLVFSFSSAYFNLLSNVNASSAIPISANPEYGFHKYVSLEGYTGYYGKTCRYTSLQGSNEVKTSLNVVSFDARGTLHGTSLINEIVPDKKTGIFTFQPSWA